MEREDSTNNNLYLDFVDLWELSSNDEIAKVMSLEVGSTI